MENSVSLLDIYKILKERLHRKIKLDIDASRYLATTLNCKTVLIRGIDQDNKELRLFVKKYDEIANCDKWKELIILKENDRYSYSFKHENITRNCPFSTNILLDWFFRGMSNLKEFLSLNSYLVFDTKGNYYISISTDSIKVQDRTKSIRTIFIDNPISDDQKEYLSNIYIDTTNLPLWLQEECELIKKPKPIQTLKRIIKGFNN